MIADGVSLTFDADGSIVLACHACRETEVARKGIDLPARSVDAYRLWVGNFMLLHRHAEPGGFGEGAL